MWKRVALSLLFLSSRIQASLYYDASCRNFPKSKQAYIDRAFHAIAGNDGILIHCEDVSNNINDKVYHVEVYPDRHFSLRLTSRTSYAKKRTVVRSQMGGDIGVSPIVRWGEETQGIVVSDWVQGDVLHTLFSEHIAQVALHLKKIHAMPIDQFKEPYTIGKRSAQRIKDILKIWPTLKENLAPYKMYLDEIESVLEPYRTRSIVHGDLNQGNIMLSWDHEVRLIDWGDSVTADPYNDLAGVSHHFHFSDTQIQDLLTQYLRRTPTQQEKNILYFTRLETLLHHGLWAYLQINRFRGSAVPPVPVDIDEVNMLLSEALCENPCLSLPDEITARRIAAMALREFMQTVQSPQHRLRLRHIKKVP